MSTLVLHYVTRFTFLPIKGIFFNLELKDLYSIRERTPQAPPPQSPFQNITTCNCCTWKGKAADSRKRHIALTDISEIELFCPRCNTYMGFINGNE